MLRILLVIFLIFIDQFSKLLVQSGLANPLIENFSCNPFIAWSIPLHGVFFWLIWLCAIGFIFYLLKKSNGNFALTMTLAGALSNFIDRIRIGCVIDFIQIGSFPTFNLADTFITLGLSIFVYQTFKNKK